MYCVPYHRSRFQGEDDDGDDDDIIEATSSSKRLLTLDDDDDEVPSGCAERRTFAELLVAGGDCDCCCCCRRCCCCWLTISRDIVSVTMGGLALTRNANMLLSTKQSSTFEMAWEAGRHIHGFVDWSSERASESSIH